MHVDTTYFKFAKKVNFTYMINFFQPKSTSSK